MVFLVMRYMCSIGEFIGEGAEEYQCNTANTTNITALMVMVQGESETRIRPVMTKQCLWPNLTASSHVNKQTKHRVATSTAG